MNETENQTLVPFGEVSVYQTVEDGLSVIDIRRPGFPKWAHQLTGAILIFIGATGIIFNCIGLYIFARNKQMRSPTNMFVIALLTCDLSMAVLGNPLASSAALHGSWFAGPVWCVWEGFVVYVFGLSALYILTAISVDRYVVIVKPLKSKAITKRVALLSVLACFLGGAFWSILPLFGWSSYGIEAVGFYCGLRYDDKSLSNTTYIIAMCIFCFTIPVLIMVYCYYYVFMTVC